MHLPACIGRRTLLVAVILTGASCDPPTADAPLAPVSGIYTAISIDDSAGPVRLLTDTLVDLAITGASLDLRLARLAIFTTNMAHSSDSSAPPVTFIRVFPIALYGDSIRTDSAGIGGRRLATTLRFTMTYVVRPPGGGPDEMTTHTFIFAQ